MSEKPDEKELQKLRDYYGRDMGSGFVGHPGVALHITTEFVRKTWLAGRDVWRAECFVPLHYRNPKRSWCMPGTKAVVTYGDSREEAEERCVRAAKKVLEQDKKFRESLNQGFTTKRVEI